MDEQAPEKITLDGSVNDVWRVGATVVRSAGPWTTAVHALLRHLESEGFDGAPRVIGFDGDGHEVLTFLEGTVPSYPVPRALWTDDVMVALAELMRRLHDATSGFEHPGPWRHGGARPGGGDIVCHNDVTLYNTVFRADRPVALIDWDYAAPGTRAWDLSYAAYRFVPLVADERVERLGVPIPVDREYRLRLLCDSYGLNDRSTLIDDLLRRLDMIVSLFITEAERGNAKFVRMVTEGQLKEYRDDRAFVIANRDRLERALVGNR